MAYNVDGKMTNKVRLYRGEIRHSQFTENWKPLLKYANKINLNMWFGKMFQMQYMAWSTPWAWP